MKEGGGMREEGGVKSRGVLIFMVGSRLHTILEYNTYHHTHHATMGGRVKGKTREGACTCPNRRICSSLLFSHLIHGVPKQCILGSACPPARTEVEEQRRFRGLWQQRAKHSAPRQPRPLVHNAHDVDTLAKLGARREHTAVVDRVRRDGPRAALLGPVV